MYYAYCLKEGLFLSEMKYAKKLNVYLFYDEKKDIFLDKDNNIVDITDKLILPRTGIYQLKKLQNAINEHGGILKVSKNDYDSVLNWPNYIKTNRKCILVEGNSLISNSEILDEIKENDIFFKTKEKNYSGIISKNDLTDEDSCFFKAINAHKNEDFIISDAVDIIKDKNSYLEYRAFIIDNKVLNISRTHDYLYSSVPVEVIDYVNEKVKELKNNNFPSCYVIDTFVYYDDKDRICIDVLECNPIETSGPYLYNSVFEGNYDLEHKNPLDIPIEKKLYENVNNFSYNPNCNSKASIFYELPGGFAADLLSFKIFNCASCGFSFMHIDSINSLENGIKQIYSDNDSKSATKKLKK